ncbi:MAG: anti-sigma factor [Bacillales bacterium]|jgi:anti-sigma factor RsiW|nr:anti-sigma factor [Bacillales bacterium]
MKPCSEVFVEKMHDYLDGDITHQEHEELFEHMKKCTCCEEYFSVLSESITFLEGPEVLEAPDNFTKKVMNNLPNKNKSKFKDWVRKYPSVLAAAIFILMMGSALTTYVTEPNQLSYTKNSQLKVANNTVIVPKGVTINEDIIVENGDLKIEGKVNGNITVINGKEYLASVGEVTGDIEEVNEFFNWIWYRIKSIFK